AASVISPVSLHDALPISSFKPPREMNLTSASSSNFSSAPLGISSPFFATFFHGAKGVKRHSTPEAIRRWACERVVACPLSTKNRSEEHTSELQSRENLVC